MKITETKSDLPNTCPIKEVMGVFIPNINVNLPNRNGFIYTLIGSGGSGKTSLLLSMFKSSRFYRCKFDNIYLFTPQSSFLSVEKHPFSNHDKVYHELTPDTLYTIYDELIDLKQTNLENGIPPEYNLVIIDDFANTLKDIDLIKTINTMLIKARHLNTAFIFTLQSYNLFPLVLRKQITNMTLFKTKNNKEWDVVTGELLNMTRDNAVQLFDYMYDKNYNHLDYDTVESKMYKNFNILNIDNGTK
jgi:ABC-type dipeptide/oligopeptide/nickel transport system ATPase component